MCVISSLDHGSAILQCRTQVIHYTALQSRRWVVFKFMHPHCLIKVLRISAHIHEGLGTTRTMAFATRCSRKLSAIIRALLMVAVNVSGLTLCVRSSQLIRACNQRKSQIMAMIVIMILYPYSIRVSDSLPHWKIHL